MFRVWPIAILLCSLLCFHCVSYSALSFVVLALSFALSPLRLLLCTVLCRACTVLCSASPSPCKIDREDGQRVAVRNASRGVGEHKSTRASYTKAQEYKSKQEHKSTKGQSRRTQWEEEERDSSLRARLKVSEGDAGTIWGRNPIICEQCRWNVEKNAARQFSKKKRINVDGILSWDELDITVQFSHS